jgi:hypothetical protein
VIWDSEAVTAHGQRTSLAPKSSTSYETRLQANIRGQSNKPSFWAGKLLVLMRNKSES